MIKDEQWKKAESIYNEALERVDAQQWVEAEGAVWVKKQFLAQRDEIAALKATLENCYQQDRLKTREINILTPENRCLSAENTALKAKIALLEAKINTTKKIIKHCQPVEPSYANEELVDALTAINKCLQ